MSWRLRLVLFLIVVAAVILFATPAFGNLWDLITGRGFFIPAESSLFTFKVTKDNPGSGEWWLYGEDRRYFYALHEREPFYLVFPRAAVERCPGFEPLNYHTWCSPMERRVPDG
ncbi:MAG TPA: hypothetical protein VGX68_26010 [Thermoanaerobaculia bacterium]|nr:hypothetical protein [Thermoanaerobaculia bacterium]